MNWHKRANRLTVDRLFYDHLLPRLKQLFPTFPAEHYSLSTFNNLSRWETGLDNRRRDNDPTFVNAGTEVKLLTEYALATYGTGEFDQYLDQLARRLVKWYVDESPSGTVVQRPTRKIDYKDLHRIGVELTPEQGRFLSRESQGNQGAQIARDDFFAAYRDYDASGDPKALKEWWDVYRGYLGTIVPMHTVRPRRRRERIVETEPATPELVYDHKTDTMVPEEVWNQKYLPGNK